MYREVAEHRQGDFHFELGEKVATRAGYNPDRIAALPPRGRRVVRGLLLRSRGARAGRDRGRHGQRIRDGRTVRRRAGRPDRPGDRRRLHPRAAGEGAQARSRSRRNMGGGPQGRIEELPVADESVDCVISNGVINLVPGKPRSFRRGGTGAPPGRAAGDRRHHHRTAADRGDRLQRRPAASCVGGAAQQEVYLQAISSAGFTVLALPVKAYEFISDQARGARPVG